MIKIFFLSAFFFLKILVRADVLVEPYLGTGPSMDGYFAIKANAFEYTELLMGSRFGYKYHSFTFGVDYTFSSLETESTVAWDRRKSKFHKTDLGLVLEYNFQIPLRIFTKWIFQSKIKGKNSLRHFSVDNDAQFTGSGLSFGIGWAATSFLSLNLEYRSLKYGKYKSRNAKSSNYNNKIYLDNLIFISISFPFLIAIPG